MKTWSFCTKDRGRFTKAVTKIFTHSNISISYSTLLVRNHPVNCDTDDTILPEIPINILVIFFSVTNCLLYHLQAIENSSAKEDSCNDMCHQMLFGQQTCVVQTKILKSSKRTWSASSLNGES